MAFATTPQIVKLTTSIAIAPQPSQLQQSGALISVGGSTLSNNAYQFCANLGQVTDILSSSGNYQELQAMATTFFAQGLGVGVYVLELGAGSGAAAQILAFITWLIANPATFYAFLTSASWDSNVEESVSGIVVNNGGSGYVDDTPPTVTVAPPESGTTATATAIVENGVVVGFIVTNPGSGYTEAPTVTIAAPTSGTTATGTAVLGTALSTVANNYSSPTAQTYFFITTTSSNLPDYAPFKSVFAGVQSSTAPSTEFTLAMAFYQGLVNNPGLANRLAPMAYRYAFGVTPWTRSSANNSIINSILSNYGNLILTGAEGGISQACLFKGTMMDGTQASWWYGVDWFQIQVALFLAAAIINGSNTNPPLLYEQNGINILQNVVQGICNAAVSFGCLLSADVSAVPFYEYTQANPSDYAAGIYNGLSASVVGQNGFLQVTLNVTVYQFVPSGSNTPLTRVSLRKAYYKGVEYKPGFFLEQKMKKQAERKNASTTH